MKLDFPFTLRSDNQLGEAEIKESVASREELLSALEGIADVSRDEADSLARKILDGQTVNVSAHGQGLRLYGSKANG
jgi:hypothetical protein